MVGFGLLSLPVLLDLSQWGAQAVVAMVARTAGMLVLTWHAWSAPAPHLPQWARGVLKWVMLVLALGSLVGGSLGLQVLWRAHLLG
ncbi:hypothetical protein Ddep01_00715 [Deinococcus depolymerans]